jgi:hypothetical protein
MDSDPMHLIKDHLKIIKKLSNLIIMTLKKRKSNIFFKKYALKCPENAFFIVGMVKKRILMVGSETGSVTFY